MTSTPLLTWILRLLPAAWLFVLLTADAGALQEAAQQLAAAPGAGVVQEWAGAARLAVLSAAENLPEDAAAARIIDLLWPQGWLLGRIDAFEAAALLFAARTASGLRLLTVTGLFWIAALYDGLVERRVAFLTFAPYRPILAMNAGTLAAVLLASAGALLAAPFAHAEGAAMTLAVAGGAMANLWARSFHRFAG